MAQLHPSVSNFLDSLVSELEQSFSQTENAAVTWTPERPESREGMQWWSCSLSVDPDCRFFAGDSTGEQFTNIEQSLQKAAQAKFGAAVLCTEAGPAEEPDASWTAVTVEIKLGEDQLAPIEFVLNPALETALGAGEEPRQELATRPPDLGAVDRLLHVQIPVSVLLGRTQMRMKDLLALNHGAIVELNQELSDEVEIRVSNCVIARGEVVAVDGNYGVRILKMLPDRNGAVAQTAMKGTS